MGRREGWGQGWREDERWMEEGRMKGGGNMKGRGKMEGERKDGERREMKEGVKDGGRREQKSTEGEEEENGKANNHKLELLSSLLFFRSIYYFTCISHLPKSVSTHHACTCYLQRSGKDQESSEVQEVVRSHMGAGN
jgi:hypothetical protein